MVENICAYLIKDKSLLVSAIGLASEYWWTNTSNCLET